MGIFEGCLFACDIDGTLMSSGYINPRNIEKIEYFMSEGGLFSLCTGRSVSAIDLVLEKLKRVSPCILSNGCMIYDYQNEKTLYEAFLPENERYTAKMVLDLGLDIGVEAHSGENVYTLFANSETEDHHDYEGIKKINISFEEALSYNWNKLIFLFKNLDDLAKVKETLKNEKTESGFSDTCTTIYGIKRNYYEQFPKGISKAAALDKLTEILGVKKGCLFAMGDYYNDLQMIKKADISAVPFDSPKDIKAFADYETCKCDDGAVADFIDYLTELRRETVL